MKRVLFDGIGNSSWIGGLYYKCNIVYSLLQNEFILQNYEIYVMVDSNTQAMFEPFSNNIKMIVTNVKNRREAQFKIILNYLKYHCDFFYCGFEKWYCFFGINEICWIPDFQIKELPQNFSNEEINRLDEIYSSLAKDNRALVVSSIDSYNAFKKYYGIQKKEIYIMPFVSYIEPYLKKITNQVEKETLQKFHLTSKKYVCIMNQFWKHKNHMVVFNAISILKRKLQCDITFVFTGKMEDYRNPDYIQELDRIIKENSLKENIEILGFIERNEQLIIMKNSEFLVQPSLYEGWGTVVEDAKVLNKTILLSDIPVHREQMNEKCILFDPHNPEKLAELILQEYHKEHHDNIEKGIEDMKKRALEYSKGFEQLLRDQEKKS